MKKNVLSVAILSILPMTSIFAAALDRSGQSISAFLQPNNYAEVTGGVLFPEVSGKDTAGNAVPDMAGSYHQITAAVKLQATKHISVGVLYDQPFGAHAEYEGTNGFTLGGSGTKVSVQTDNITALVGYQPNEQWNFYVGPQYQRVKGEVDLKGTNYSTLAQGYNPKFDTSGDWGWVAGVAYQKPEIALKASLTYRSEVKIKANTTESVANPTLAAVLGAGQSKTEIVTPQSVNLDFQTGIMKDTVAFANIRWVNWKDFSIQPNVLKNLSTRAGQTINLVDYSKDQWSVTAGVGRKFSDKWSGSASVLWDSGAGNPVTTLGPVDGYWGLGLAAQYSPANNYFVAGSVRYFWLGDATAQTGARAKAGEFSNNNAIAYGIKLGYRF